MPEGDIRLKPDDIDFLALEGGGGKGFAYLGALQVLEEQHVMEHLKGVSGTSAGAITALMIALGMNAADIAEELERTNFDLFFDPPTGEDGNILTPRAGGYLKRKPSACELTMLKGWDPTRALEGARAGVGSPSANLVGSAFADLVARATGSAGAGAVTDVIVSFLAGSPAAAPSRALAAVVQEPLRCLLALDNMLAVILQSYAWILSGPGARNRDFWKTKADDLAREKPATRAVLDRLVGSLPEYLVYLDREMGLFSGQAARAYFEILIQTQLEKALKKKYGNAAMAQVSNVTFRELWQLNQDHKLGFRDLLVCGANLSYGRSVLFSLLHTPDFPIADAVRISMSLPVIYKPYIVPEDVRGYPPCGTYVDGGLWNNLPYREIGTLAALAEGDPPDWTPSVQEDRRALSAALNQRKTLGLRLEIVPPEPVLRAQSVISKVLTVPGETQILPDLAPYMQILDTTGLDTLQFSPPQAIRTTVTKRSRRAMLGYFGIEPSEDDQDEADERASEALRSQSLCQSFSGENAPLLPQDYGRWR